MNTNTLNEQLLLLANNFAKNMLGQMQTLNNKLEDEFLLTVQEKQLNDALARFVTRNVRAIREMKIELHDGWFRLSCIVYIKGIYAHLASNFDLVHIQLDRQRQRLVFAQQGDTEILELYTKNFLHKIAINKGVPLYRKIMKEDPLGLILKKINLARVKENVFYIDIGRWLRKNKKIMTNLYKVQVNYGRIAPHQLVLQAKANPRDLLAMNESGNIISEKDKPE
ncbi:MAG: hypothetical protein KGV51_01855 [Moraxellaceae bacterium]|nr:hypothetical protein [Moraxellaceae bacterium]